jgi:hypothetical protein
MAEGRKEVLRHGTIVAELFRIMPNKVPTRKLKAANLFEHCFSIHGLKVFLLGLVRSESVGHLSFDHRNLSVSQADLVAGVDNGSSTDSCSVDPIIRHISIESDGGILDARDVATERIDSARRILGARGVVKQCVEPGGSIVVARSVEDECLDSSGGVGGVKYTGEFRDGKPNGHGTYTTPTGFKYIGEYRDGERNGFGTVYSAEELQPIYDLLVEEYAFFTFERYGSGYVAYSVLADLVEAGWRRETKNTSESN